MYISPNGLQFVLLLVIDYLFTFQVCTIFESRYWIFFVNFCVLAFFGLTVLTYYYSLNKYEQQLYHEAFVIESKSESAREAVQIRLTGIEKTK